MPDKRSSRGAIVKWFLPAGRWLTREALWTPVVSSLITAGILYLAIVAFQEPIYKHLRLRKAQGFPGYCTTEAGKNGDHQAFDLFVVNLSPRWVTRVDLKNYLASQGNEYTIGLGPDIILSCSFAGGAKILSVAEDSLLDQDAGRLSFQLSSDSLKCTVGVDSIQGGMVLHAVFVTSEGFRWPRSQTATMQAHVSYDYAGL